MPARRRDGLISDGAVKKATGKSSAQWFRILETLGRGATHKERATYIHDKKGCPPWWSQMVTVEYERKIGLRKVGQNSRGDFAARAQKTLPLAPKEAWSRLSRGNWFDGKRVRISAGAKFRLADGTTGEVRVVAPRKRIRFTWKPADASPTTTVEVRVTRTQSGKTAVVFDQAGLSSKTQSARMRKRWERALGTIARQA